MRMSSEKIIARSPLYSPSETQVLDRKIDVQCQLLLFFVEQAMSASRYFHYDLQVNLLILSDSLIGHYEQALNFFVVVLSHPPLIRCLKTLLRHLDHFHHVRLEYVILPQAPLLCCFHHRRQIDSLPPTYAALHRSLLAFWSFQEQTFCATS